MMIIVHFLFSFQSAMIFLFDLRSYWFIKMWSFKSFIWQGNISAFCDGLLDCLATELKATKDFSKLYAGIAILGFIASLSQPVKDRGFTHLLTLLGHRYPKVGIALFFSRTFKIKIAIYLT